MKTGGTVVIYGLMGGMNFTGNALACLFNEVRVAAVCVCVYIMCVCVYEE